MLICACHESNREKFRAPVTKILRIKVQEKFFHTFLMGNISYEIFYYKNGTVCNVRIYVILIDYFIKLT